VSLLVVGVHGVEASACPAFVITDTNPTMLGDELTSIHSSFYFVGCFFNLLFNLLNVL
jgi:hypothetical protein